MIAFPSGTIVIKKVNNFNDFEEDSLTAGNLPISTTGSPYEEANVSGTNLQDAFESLTSELVALSSNTNTSITTLSGLIDTNASDIVSLSGYVDDTYVSLSGDIMTGFLTLSADPIDDLHAVPKRYLENSLTVQSGITLIDAVLSGTGHTSVVGGSLEIKSHEGFTGSEFSLETVSGTTTDDTPLTVHSLDVPQGGVLFLEADMLGNRDQAIDYAVAYNAARAVYYRDGVGALTRIGSVDSFNRATGVGANGYNVELVIVGNAVEVQVDGANAHTVYWTGLVKHQILITGT